MTCRDCFHWKACKSMLEASGYSVSEMFKGSAERCNTFAPTADVVEVVLCKDCKYWQDNNGGYPHEECRWGKDETPDAGDYCSHGERKEKNNG